MRAKTTDGQEFDLKQDLLDGLKMRMRGQLLFPGEPGYDDSRTVWNGMIDRRPAAVARCLGTSDVIECVKLAAANDLLLCIKSGGHNIAGLACADGGLTPHPERRPESDNQQRVETVQRQVEGVERRVRASEIGDHSPQEKGQRSDEPA